MKAVNKMTKRSKKLSIAIAGLVSLTVATIAFAAQPTVGLGTASSYAVLAGSGITNTGATTVSGSAGSNMGSDPTPAFTGDTLVTNNNGTNFLVINGQTTGAKADLVTAYDDAAGRIPFTTPAGGLLGGLTLTQGVYQSGSSLDLTGTLTLDAEFDPNAVFIFQAGSTLTTASSSVVSLINGAQACNVFWKVDSATFGTSTDFTGHVLALTTITANTGATFKGQLLARNGAVTLDNNTIINDVCVTPTATATPTTTPTATPDAGSGSSDDNTTVTATATATPATKTVTGGKLPNTDIPIWAFSSVVGIVLIGIGSYALVMRRKRR
jgi:hypothetical protein